MSTPPPIPYVRDIQFEYGVVDQVSPLIRRVVAKNPGPFTFTGTGTYVVGRGEVAVLDPGPDMAEHMDAILAATAGERITHILITHSHMDHSPLARPLAERTGAVIYACSGPCVETASDVRLEAGDDLVFRPDEHLYDGMVLSGPGWTIEAVKTPGHTSNHYCYALKEENALFSGDHVMGWSTTVISPPDGDMGDYYASLRKILERGYATLWPTHGPPVTEPKPFLEAYLAHRLERERQILERLDAGDRRIKEMIPTIYAAVSPRLWPAAAHSVLAHLIHLVRTGVVQTDGEPTLDGDYRPIARAA